MKKMRYWLLISVNGKWVRLSNIFVPLKKNHHPEEIGFATKFYLLIAGQRYTNSSQEAATSEDDIQYLKRNGAKKLRRENPVETAENKNGG